MSDQLEFFHYNKTFKLENFQIKQKDLDKYVKNTLGQHESRLLSRHYLGILNKETIVSVICMSTSVIRYEDLEKRIEDYPKDTELPTIKIGRLCVDDKFQRKGFGTQTMKKAISIFVDISNKVGVLGLTVDSKEDSIGFYEKMGFRKLRPVEGKDYTPMILYTKTIKQALPALFETPI